MDMDLPSNGLALLAPSSLISKCFLRSIECSKSPSSSSLLYIHKQKQEGMEVRGGKPNKRRRVI